MRDETGWDIMSGTAIEEKPKSELEPRIELKIWDCNLNFSGDLARLMRYFGMKQEATTQNPDGSISIFFKLKG